MVDLTGLPVLDVHCHPFLDQGPLDVDEFVTQSAFGGGTQRYMEDGGIPFTAAVQAEVQRNKRDTLYFRRMMLNLAAFFDIEPEPEAVVAARNAAIEKGYTEYVRRLFDAVGLTTLVVDFGYPLPMHEIAQVRAELPAEIIPVFRIEPLIVDLLDAKVGWSEFRRLYDEAITTALGSGGFKGLKSVIAYRTGLDVSPLSRSPDQGLLALDAIHRGLGGGTKKLRDHLLCRAMELCIEHDVPIQIHTGMGDYEVNLVLSRPAYLMDLLRFPAFRACKVLLVHTGYPFHGEAGYMANVLPRVYCDVSEGVPFAGHGAARIFREVLEMAPISKVVYGSDGFRVPEINFTSAMVGKEALGRVLNDLVAEGMLREADAQAAAGMILAANARELYRLD